MTDYLDRVVKFYLESLSNDFLYSRLIVISLTLGYLVETDF